MARPRKKPGYDAEKVRNDFFQEMAECYKESSKVSLRDVAAEFDIMKLMGSDPRKKNKHF